MSISAILLLTAIGGWGAFAYATYSAQGQERAFRDDMAQLIAERDALRTELSQIRVDAERKQQALERAQTQLTRARTQPLSQPATSAPPAAPPRVIPPPAGTAPRTPPAR